MSRTVLAFHAHPDDEALLTGGTLAKAAAAGHRVILVTATDGGLGLTSSAYPRERLGEIRLAELRASAAALGAARVEWLGYADSGLSARGTDSGVGAGSRGVRFVDATVDEAASRLAAILEEESVDVLLSYDRNGGYGHPDHAMVHRVGAAAAILAGTPRVLEARVSPRVAAVMKPRGLTLAPLVPVTHVIDVRDYLGAKRAAMRAHRSQLASDSRIPRNIDLLTRLPEKVFAAAVGTERFSDPTAAAASPSQLSTDIFAGLA
ncbi:MAG: PIG-L family deacetylase [Dermatophilaceae bacterium]|nr:PIG-L family deacetylase [Dermatophilaceae bacterium]MBP9918367.1 PIG-L family deacetylase [Dermatophilaceae bacterium]